LVEEAMHAGARQGKCAEVLGRTLRTLKRWRADPADGRTRERIVINPLDKQIII
jgi:hypothetical protein